MLRFDLRSIALIVVWAAFPLESFAYTIEGIVRHGYKDIPVAAAEVFLVKIDREMATVATVKTDPKGKFLFDDLPPMTHPYLVRVSHMGVFYQEMVQGGGEKGEVRLTLYDSSPNPPDLSFPILNILARAQGNLLHLEKTYYLQNNSLQTYANSQGTFRFAVHGHHTPAVAAVHGGIPVPVTVMNTKEEEVFNIAYPLRPGLTEVTVSYDLDYSTHELFWKELTLYDIERVNLAVIPPGLEIRSDLFEEVEVREGHEKFALYSATAVLKDHWLAASFKGEGEESQSPDATRAPSRLFQYQWPLIGLMMAFLASGAYVGWRQRRGVRKEQSQ